MKVKEMLRNAGYEPNVVDLPPPALPRFKGGDVVQLKSGGPIMTVGGLVGAPGGWLVCWYASPDNSEIHSAEIDSDALKMFEPERQPQVEVEGTPQVR